MLTNIAALQAKINGKLHSYLLEGEVDIQDVKEFLFMATKFIGNIEDQQKAQQAAQEAEKAPVTDEAATLIEPIAEPPQG